MEANPDSPLQLTVFLKRIVPDRGVSPAGLPRRTADQRIFRERTTISRGAEAPRLRRERKFTGLV